MEIIFLAGLFPHELRKIIENNSKGVIQSAADALQWAFVSGLSHYFQVRIINLPFVGSYPKLYKRPYVPSCTFRHSSGADCVSIDFINLPLIKNYFRYVNAKKELEKLCENTNNYKIIIIYAIHSPFLKAVAEVKHRYPNVKLCLIVPDLPQYMTNNQSYIYSIMKWLDSIVIHNAMKEVDCFVLLSSYMADAMNIGSKPWVNIEGIYNPDDKDVTVMQKETNKTVLYTGTLDERYGIINLLDAFMSIKKDNYRLWICGDGDCRKVVEKCVQLDKRIIYFDQKPREDVLCLQKKATVLVNPRTSEGIFTKYSFPSKTIEYMASGTPCIINRLQGIPDDYYQYCFVPKQENVNGLKEAIITVCEKDQSELNVFGEKASLYIQEHKNPFKQIEKLYDMFKNLGWYDYKA